MAERKCRKSSGCVRKTRCESRIRLPSFLSISRFFCTSFAYKRLSAHDSGESFSHSTQVPFYFKAFCSILSPSFRLLGPFPVDAKLVDVDLLELLPWFTAARWLHFMHLSAGANLKTLAAKQSLSLLRCSEETLPSDKVKFS